MSNKSAEVAPGRMTEANYVSQKSRLLKDFDRLAHRARRVLISRYGEKEANTLIRESRREYEALIPQIPYIGEKSPMLIFLLPTSRYLAVYWALQKRGGTVEGAGRLIYEMCEAEAKAIPGPVRRLMGCLWFSPLFLRRVKKRAAESQKRQYPGGYVFTYVEGNGRDSDWGIDYFECSSCKLLKAQNAMELAPYVCAVDKVTSELLGWGLTRTMTLAEGFEKCDFRFKKGGETRVETRSKTDKP
jgi:L-2-amino-thiazoline-4-carboxylic acid hydrolase